MHWAESLDHGPQQSSTQLGLASPWPCSGVPLRLAIATTPSPTRKGRRPGLQARAQPAGASAGNFGLAT
jgi:hypothetical protein